MLGVQVPLAVTGSISVCAGVALALHVAVQAYVEVVTAPVMVPAQGSVAAVFYALVNRIGLAVTLSLGVCIDVAAGQVDAASYIYVGIHAYALDICFVNIVTLAYGLEFGVQIIISQCSDLGIGKDTVWVAYSALSDA